MYGVVFVSCGGVKPAQSSRNFSSCEKDSYLHDGPGQLNPEAFSCVQLFSCQGDRVLDGLRGTGVLTVIIGRS